MTTESDQLLADLDYLEGAGLTTEQLRRLHHFRGRPQSEPTVTFKSTRDYFGKGQAMRENNANFAARLNSVATWHKGGLDALVECALVKHLV